MRIRTRTIASGATVAALGVLAAAALPAQARWHFHDDRVGETVLAPPGSTRATTCAGRLEAVAGWGRFIDVDNGEDPDAQTLTPDAFGAVSYRVWKAPAGFDSFDLAQEDGTRVFFPGDQGNEIDAELVGSRTTPARTLLPTPRPAWGDPGRSDNFVFTTAPLKVTLTGVRPGDVLGLTPAGGGGGIYVDLRAIDCRLSVLRPRVDLVPGSAANTVHPHSTTDLLPVRVFGARGVAVRRIQEIHLGEAAPVEVRAPRDRNGDGRADRVYVFRQDDTGIQCLDRKVRVTGRTSDRVRFQASAPITTAGCTG